MKKTALTIAGSDPTGFAGLQADLKAFSDLGVIGVSAATAITAQNLVRVKKVLPARPGLLKEEVGLILEEFKPAAVKIGMLATVENAAVVRRLIKSKKLKNIVLDPVLYSSGGHPLLGKKGVSEIKKMLPLVRLLTPNLIEASLISGMKIKDLVDMKRAAVIIHSLGASNVLVKGGHLEGAPVDILYDGGRFTLFKGRRLKGDKRLFHGTGCVLSSAIAAYLARGFDVRTAALLARRYLVKVLENRVKARG